MSKEDNPNFLPRDWKQREKDWLYIEDVYKKLADTDVKRYLKQAIGEFADSYNRRAELAVFDSIYTEAIDSYASLLNEFTLLPDTPDDVLNLLDNVDGTGDDLASFAQGSDISCLNYGATCIFIDPAENNGTRPPRLRQIDLKDIRAPQLTVIEGEVVLTRIVIVREVEELKEGSTYETEILKEYWEYTPGQYQVYRQDKKNNQYVPVGRPVIMTGANGAILERIPIVWFSAMGATQYFKPPIPPFLTLAKLNVKHMNKVSELDAVESKCNLPTWKRWHLNPPGDGGVYPSLVVGADAVINLQIGEDAKLEEPQGTAIASTQARIKELEKRMGLLARIFLMNAESPTQKTATEAVIESNQSKATLQGVVHQKESAYQQVFEWLNVFTDPNFLTNFARNNGNVPIGGIDVNESILKAPPSAEDVRMIFQGFTEGVYNNDVAIAKLKEIGFWPKSYEADTNHSEEEQSQL